MDLPDRHNPDLDPAPEPAPAGLSPGHSLWSLKPWWCQPWSIVLTGIFAVAGSWLLWQRWWLTAPAAVAVLLWWWLFLVLAPRAYSQSLGNP